MLLDDAYIEFVHVAIICRNLSSTCIIDGANEYINNELEQHTLVEVAF